MLVGCGVYASGQNLLSGCALVLAMVATALTTLRMAVINTDLGPHHNNGTTENDAVAWQGSRTSHDLWKGQHQLCYSRPHTSALTARLIPVDCPDSVTAGKLGNDVYLAGVHQRIGDSGIDILRRFSAR